MGRAPQDSKNDCDQPRDSSVAIIAEEIGTLNRRKRPAATDVKVRYITVIKSNRDKPCLVRRAQPQLFDRQYELFVLITLTAGKAPARKTCNKNQRPPDNCTPDHC